MIQNHLVAVIGGLTGLILTDDGVIRTVLRQMLALVKSVRLLLGLIHDLLLLVNLWLRRLVGDGLR